MTFKPMLAVQADLDRLTYPVYGSPKIDGIRCSNVDGRALTRSLKEIPNRHVYNQLNFKKFHDLDGELVVGEPTSHTCYRDTVSGIMSDGGEPDYTYWVFDVWNSPAVFDVREYDLRARIGHCIYPVQFKLVPHQLLRNRADLDVYEAQQIELGYEGIMLNRPNALYRNGRSTLNSAELLKVKRFVDSEALVIGIVEEMHNGNAATTNELGRTKRSTAKAGKTGKGTMGALQVRDVKTGVEFEIGTGFTAGDRVQLDWVGKTVKYKYFPIGVKDKPRHPVYLGLRPQGA